MQNQRKITEENQNSELKANIASLKEKLLRKKQEIEDIEKLINKKLIDEKTEDNSRVNFLELSEDELINEMVSRLFSLGENTDCTPRGEIRSHRKIIGVLIVLLKKIVRKITSPYTNLLLERQKKFNEELATYQLASFIRFKFIDDRLKMLERQLIELKEKQESIIEAIQSLSEKNKKE